MVQSAESWEGLNLACDGGAYRNRPTCWRVLRQPQMRPVLMVVVAAGRPEEFGFRPGSRNVTQLCEFCHRLSGWRRDNLPAAFVTQERAPKRCRHPFQQRTPCFFCTNLKGALPVVTVPLTLGENSNVRSSAISSWRDLRRPGSACGDPIRARRSFSSSPGAGVGGNPSAAASNYAFQSSTKGVRPLLSFRWSSVAAHSGFWGRRDPTILTCCAAIRDRSSSWPPLLKLLSQL